jgi:hypothetical protein
MECPSRRVGIQAVASHVARLVHGRKHAGPRVPRRLRARAVPRRPCRAMGGAGTVSRIRARNAVGPVSSIRRGGGRSRLPTPGHVDRSSGVTAPHGHGPTADRSLDRLEATGRRLGSRSSCRLGVRPRTSRVAIPHGFRAGARLTCWVHGCGAVYQCRVPALGCVAVHRSWCPNHKRLRPARARRALFMDRALATTISCEPGCGHAHGSTWLRARASPLGAVGGVGSVPSSTLTECDLT